MKMAYTENVLVTLDNLLFVAKRDLMEPQNRVAFQLILYYHGIDVPITVQFENCAQRDSFFGHIHNMLEGK